MTYDLMVDQNKFKMVLEDAAKLRWQKLNDYGPTYNEYGYVGLLVKLGDKYGRIKSLYEKSLDGEEPNFESARDSLVDLLNYSAMAIMELDKKEKENETT